MSGGRATWRASRVTGDESAQTRSHPRVVDPFEMRGVNMLRLFVSHWGHNPRELTLLVNPRLLSKPPPTVRVSTSRESNVAAAEEFVPILSPGRSTAQSWKLSEKDLSVVGDVFVP